MYKLVIGNKNYSSWSLRPWLLMKVAGLNFEEINVELYSEEGKKELFNYSGAGKVPVLIADDMTIWDSLAIVEYLAEQHPEKALWPLANDSRAIARSVTSEMHSSFMAVRSTLPMNCRLLKTVKNPPSDLQKDVDRICQIWRDCRNDYGEQGQFLFGSFSIVDAFYAPVVLRFHSYSIPVGEIEKAYINKVLSLPELQEWISTAKKEDTIVEAYENITT